MEKFYMYFGMVVISILGVSLSVFLSLYLLGKLLDYINKVTPTFKIIILYAQNRAELHEWLEQKKIVQTK